MVGYVLVGMFISLSFCFLVPTPFRGRLCISGYVCLSVCLFVLWFPHHFVVGYVLLCTFVYCLSFHSLVPTPFRGRLCITLYVCLLFVFSFSGSHTISWSDGRADNDLF